jgi:4'-phosphopantetheinyl transferase EntD
MSGLLLSLLPAEVCGAELFDTGQAVPLAPEDAALMTGASEVRRRDFALGRACARAALAQAGAPPAVGRAPHGAPLWPPGFTGSITHTQGYAAAIVARTGDFTGLGVDAERMGRVGEGLHARLFGAQERAWLAGRPELATLLFAAKEAAFKSSNPPAGMSLDFQALHIEVDAAGGFAVRGRPGEGRYVIGGGLALACLLVR